MAVHQRDDVAEPEAPPREHGRVWTFAVDKGMPLLTAVLTVLAAALGVWGVKANDDKAELASTLDAVEDERNVLREDNAILVTDLDDMAQSRDTWKERAESAAEEPEDEAPVTTLPDDTIDPDASPGDVPAGPAGIFRQTGTAPVTFAASYGIDLDTRATDWGVGGGGDLQFSGGDRLYVASGKVALVDQEATYDHCAAQTVLQGSLTSEQTVVGRQFCMTTSDRRWAFVKIIGLDAGRETITLHVVVFTLATE